MQNIIDIKSGMEINESVKFNPGQFFSPQTIEITADNIVVDFTGVTLVGKNKEGLAINLTNRHNVKIIGLTALYYYHGIKAEKCSGITIENCNINYTNEVETDQSFLNIWQPLTEAYGAAVLFGEVKDSTVINNNFEHNLNGLLTYNCTNLSVTKNKANYCTGFAFHLFYTSDSLFEDNSADYCCRYNTRVEGLGLKRKGHMGADATGFLILTGSNRNVFRRNYARMGGDGFFLAGCNPQGERIGANDNLFEENDASLSPNIAFEATFARGNIFRNNLANNGNFGFWLGFSWDNVIEGNQVVGNRLGGIAVENAYNMSVTNNTFHGNGYGVLLWSTVFKHAGLSVNETADTSHDWIIENNLFNKNKVAIRIAAMQDHGIRPKLKDQVIEEKSRPFNHQIVNNNIQDNRIGVELVNCDKTIIKNNMLHTNPEANIVQIDCKDTEIMSNLGSVGAYLI